MDGVRKVWFGGFYQSPQLIISMPLQQNFLRNYHVYSSQGRLWAESSHLRLLLIRYLYRVPWLITAHGLANLPPNEPVEKVLLTSENDIFGGHT